MDIEYENCTGHQIKVFGPNDGVLLDLEPAERAARVRQRKTGVKVVGGIPTATKVIRQVENLPDPEPNTLYVVSGYVKNVLDHRDDLVSPDTSSHSVVLDDNGEIKGVRRLTR